MASFFDDWLLPALAVAVNTVLPGSGPAIAGTTTGTQAATAATAANAANTAANVANAANTAANVANAANTAANVANAGQGIMQAVTNPYVATEAVKGAVLPDITDVATAAVPTPPPIPDATGIMAAPPPPPVPSAPNMGQVIPPPNANAIPGMPDTANFGSVYQTPNNLAQGFPDILGREAGNFGANVSNTASSAFERGFNKVSELANKGFDWYTTQMEKNPIPTAFTTASLINTLFPPEQPKMPGEEKGGKKLFRLSPNFQGSFPTPKPYKWGYAEGGIASLAGGGMGKPTYPQSGFDASAYGVPSQNPISGSAIDSGYEMRTDTFTGEPIGMAEGGIASIGMQPQMQQMQPQTPPVSIAPMANFLLNNVKPEYLAQAANSTGQGPAGPMAAPPAPAQGFAKGGSLAAPIDTGIISEDDPDFAFASPYKIAHERLKKLYKKTHVKQNPPEAAPDLGTIATGPANVKKAARGGIMDNSLGGYASGGNPRLLKGPGDGMSDDIPATIANRQPARLADGEFVIPADVVSHLGNGSTDAGAKKLHSMMNNVRKARTGRKAQGRQINPDRFLPK